MRTALLLLILVAAPSLAAQQTVWKWVDERGVTHYSDRPVPGATRMELNVRPSPAASEPAPAAPAAAAAPEEPAPTYQTLEIWKPGSNETIANSGGVVQVNIRVEPGLHSGHTLDLYLDNRRVEGLSGNSTELRDVPRGTHTLIAVIRDRNNRDVLRSSPVSFTVRQQSAAQPPVGPALRPPPKPTPRTTTNKVRTTQPTYAALNGGGMPVIDPRTNLPVRKAKPSSPPKAPAPPKKKREPEVPAPKSPIPGG